MCCFLVHASQAPEQHSPDLCNKQHPTPRMGRKGCQESGISRRMPLSNPAVPCQQPPYIFTSQHLSSLSHDMANTVVDLYLAYKKATKTAVDWLSAQPCSVPKRGSKGTFRSTRDNGFRDMLAKQIRHPSVGDKCVTRCDRDSSQSPPDV